jgi:hypothetical protein
MEVYSKYKPSGFDTPGLGLRDRQDWFVFLGRNRDSDCLAESNFACALKELGGESKTVEIHRFGHWLCGWLEIILIAPSAPDKVASAEEMIDALSDYPILDESDFSERETEAAQHVWKNCYSTKDRVEYIKKHCEQFEFRSFSDMLGCVRGNYFSGYANELLT